MYIVLVRKKNVQHQISQIPISPINPVIALWLFTGVRRFKCVKTKMEPILLRYEFDYFPVHGEIRKMLRFAVFALATKKQTRQKKPFI